MRDFEAYKKTLVEKLRGISHLLDSRYYLDTYRTQTRLFRSLKRMRVDAVALEKLQTAHPSNSRLLSFEPDNEGFAEEVVYDRHATRTGRLTVVEGPQILTLERDFRHVIISAFPGGRVRQPDFAALEMRVLLYESGFKCDEVDLYADIQKKYLPNISREQVKGAVLASRYGMKKQAWGPKVGLQGSALEAVDEVLTAQFGANELLCRLKEQFITKGYIRNKYGRKILIEDPRDHLLINAYAQSTGVDISLLGFLSILPKVEDNGGVGLYILHDAFGIDLPEKSIDSLGAYMKVKVPGFIQSFVVKV
jgi:hypothetical protein